MTAEEWVGQIIAGKYRVEALLGKGGMGLVLHARHIRLDEQVAIKVLLPAMLEVPGMTTRFLREAQAASKIKSRHVARVTDVDVLPDGAPYMIMEYLDGMSLAALRRQKGPLEILDAVRMVLEACDAIAEAHSLGIVHRDLKPANLFLARDRDGEEIVKVLDFGISKIDAPGEQDTTKTGQMMGSPRYMAPEQMLSMHDVDGRSDIWSLGAILYDFVAGRPPFVADSVAQLCSLVLHARPPAPRTFRADLPEDLEAVILRCLERERVNRFAAVADLVAALAPFAPPGARIPATRGPSSSSGLYLRASWSEAGVPPPSTEAPADAERPTEAVPSVARQPALPSVTPPSMRSATLSMWSSALRDRTASRLRPRALAAGAVALLVLVAAGSFALQRAPATSPAAGAASAITPPAPTATESAAAGAIAPLASPTASSTPTGAEEASITASAASPASPAPPEPTQRPLSRPLKKTTDTPPADPFLGRRR